MNENIETEVKLRLTDIDEMQRQLQEAGAVLVKPRVFERNVRYENASHTLAKQGIVVRLRKDDRIRLTYKEPGEVVDGVVSRYEFEVQVSDLDVMNTILGKLGYTPSMIYEKYRTTYHLNDTEIVLDELPYGDFIEVEGKQAQIEAVLEKLNYQHQHRYVASYARLFDFVRHHLQLSIQDLTFENFENTSVPEEAFRSP